MVVNAGCNQWQAACCVPVYFFGLLLKYTCCSVFSSLIPLLDQPLLSPVKRLLLQSVAVMSCLLFSPFVFSLTLCCLSFSSIFSPVPCSFFYVCSMETLCCTSVSNSVPLYFPFYPPSFFPSLFFPFSASSPAIVSSVL